MASEKPIDELRNIDRPWIRTVTIAEKYSAFASSRSPTKLQKLIFSDEKGAKVEGIMFNKAYETMSSKLQLYKSYKIANANIKEIDPQYRRGDIGVQWIIDTSTVIEEIPVSIHPVQNSYVPFEKIPQHLHKPEELIDVIGVVAHCLPIRSVKTAKGSKNVQKFVLIDEKLQPLTLAMWQEFISNEGQQLQRTVDDLPVLICHRLRVDSFHGIEVSTHYRSSLLIDGPDERSMELKTWAKQHRKEIIAVITSLNQFSPKIPVPTTLDAIYTSVGYILPSQNMVTSEVKITFRDIAQSYYYMACVKCFHSTTASLDYEFTCNLCEEKQVAQPRCRFDAYLIDDSGIITATFFGQPAEKLLGLTAMEAIDGVTKEYIDARHSVIDNVDYVVQIKVSKLKEGELSPRYTVFNFAEKSSLEAQSSALQLTQKGDDLSVTDDHTLLYDVPPQKFANPVGQNSPELEIQAPLPPTQQLIIQGSTTPPPTQSKAKKNLLAQLESDDLQVSNAEGKKPKLD